MEQSLRQHLIFLLSVLLPFCRDAQVRALRPAAFCFNGDGTLTDDFACNTSPTVSFCCPVGWSCLSNGLCQYGNSTSFVEGTCTDKSFPPGACTGYCIASMFLGALLLQSCPMVGWALADREPDKGGNQGSSLMHNCDSGDSLGAGDVNSWCCAGNQDVSGQGDDCCKGDFTTSLAPFPYSTITVITSITRTLPTTGTYIRAPWSRGSSAPKSRASQTAAPTDANATSPPASTASPSSSGSSSSSKSNRNVALGAGIGVPLGVLLLACIGMLFYRERRARQRIAQIEKRYRDEKSGGKTSLLGDPNPWSNNEQSPEALDGELPAERAAQEVAGKQRHELQSS